ncbi:MAG: cob(I)yrinic acid a,c-diamide adenosyltransferase [Candidatus Odinarchaeota archaeon]
MRNGGGRVVTYYGDGDGKTTAALGHAIRAAGQNRKVIIFHFLKGRRDVGEYLFFEQNCSNIEVHLCGRPEFFIPGSDPKPYIEDIEKCMSQIEEIIKKNKCDMLILDEILYAIEYNMISTGNLLEILRKRRDMHIILTGGKITDEIKQVSDIITEMKEIHHHYKHDRETIQGLDY